MLQELDRQELPLQVCDLLQSESCLSKFLDLFASCLLLPDHTVF